jgi:hypothetical protein
MMKCRQVTELCSRELEQPLSVSESVNVRLHLMMCTGCTRFRRQIRILRDVSRAYADGEGASPDAPGDPPQPGSR